MRYLLLGVGIGLLLSSLFLIYMGQDSQEMDPMHEEGLVVRFILLGGEVESVKRREDVYSLQTPSFILPPPLLIEEEEEEIEEEEGLDEEELEEREGEEELQVEVEIREISIPYTTPVSRIIEILLQAELIDDGEAFLEEIVDRGVSHLLQAGEYMIEKGTETGELINILLGRRGEDV